MHIAESSTHTQIFVQGATFGLFEINADIAAEGTIVVVCVGKILVANGVICSFAHQPGEKCWQDRTAAASNCQGQGVG